MRNRPRHLTPAARRQRRTARLTLTAALTAAALAIVGPVWAAENTATGAALSLDLAIALGI